ncbi:MAG: thioredoxin family protein [bacterium]
MKGILPVLIIVLLFGACGCSLKKSEAPVAATSRDYIESTEEISWVSTEVVHAPDTVGHDLSMIVFSTSWCGWCRKLEQWTFTDSEVVAIVGESFNAIQIDADSYESVPYGDSTMTCHDLSRDVFGVSAFPTICFVSRGGDLVRKVVGYNQWDAYAAILRDVRGF